MGRIVFRFCGLSILTLTFFGAEVRGQSYKQGMIHYTKGNFTKAVTVFESALKFPASNSERAKTYKFLGISQYMTGRKSSAATSFQKAQQLDRSLTIKKAEVLDEGVIGFFLAQKGAATRPKRVASGKVATSSAAKSAAGGGKIKTTNLRVVSNVANATVMIDGILAGKSGETLEVDPGLAEIQVSASGYQTRKIRTRINAKQLNVATVNLTKPVVKKPVPVAKPKVKPKVVATYRKKKAPRRARPLKRKPARSKSSDDIFMPDDDDNLPLRTRPRPPPKPAGRDLASEFMRDTATGGAPSYTPAAGYRQPYQQQPMYTPAPPPQYGYGAYQQPYVSSPPPPPSLPAGGYGNYYPPPSKRYGSRRRSKKRGKPNYAISIIPFGAGQFYNRDFLLGALFAGGEVGCLYMWYSKNQEADKFIDEANAELANSEGVDEEELVRFEQESASHADQIRQQGYIWLGGAGALWAIGSIQAIMVGPKRSRRRAQLWDPDDPTGQGTALVQVARPLPFQMDWDLGLVQPQPMRGVPPALALQLRATW